MRIANDSLAVSNVEAPFDMASSFVTDGFYLGHIAYFSIQAFFTGSPTGNFTLEASNDKGIEDRTSGGWSAAGVSNWTTVADSAFPVTAAGDVMWDVQNVGYRWVRVRWTWTAGSGSVTSIRANAKGI